MNIINSRNKDNRILFVVGNGLDIAMKYPTSPDDCNTWLNHKKYDLVYNNEYNLRFKLNHIFSRYPNPGLLCGGFWKNVEGNIPNVMDPPSDNMLHTKDDIARWEGWYENLWHDIILLL